jgi:hypothetical protein
MTERHEYVTPGELASKIETVDAKISALRAWGVAAFLGGQALAGLVAALVTRTTPADAGRVAARAVASLF